MAHANLKNLVARLDPLCRRALEAAAGMCLSRTQYNVEIEHYLLKLLEPPGSDLHAILRAFDVDASRLQARLTRAIDGLKTGNARPPALGAGLVDLVREGWLVASIEFGEATTRSGHLLGALLADDQLARIAEGISPELAAISVDALFKDFAAITRNTEEAARAAQAPAAAAGGPSLEAPRPGGLSKTPALDQFATDLTAQARAGRIDPVLGRDDEIRQIVDILMRRRQNNPILTGEAGVGKTSVVEGFALRIAAGDVPDRLKNVQVRSLDLGLLQAGAGVKGEFENRLKSVVEEIKASPVPIVLFIDEAHAMIGAGGQAGQGDAANMLKPALARGELRTIAATTWAEYKKYFEKDAALSRRFQVVKVEEPDEETAEAMLRGLVPTLEKHHGLRILHEALRDAVRLSKRYISGRQLPDKAVGVLDTTCARIALGRASLPAKLEDAGRRIEQLQVSIDILRREAATGTDHAAEIEELAALKSRTEGELATLTERWKQEKELVDRVLEIHDRLQGDGTDAATKETDADPTKTPPAGTGAPPQVAAPVPPPLDDAERERLRTELAETRSRLSDLQGDDPLVHAWVDSQSVAETIAAWTGIPLGRMVADEIQTVLRLKDLLEETIVGQSHALDRIAQRIRTSRAGLRDPRTPIGVFLLAGTSGVGKTETAVALANLLYGGEQNMTVINMSEFKEEHKVSLLMGSPPGYVGYGEGGVLTEAVRRRPYGVILLDEMEKAHPGVQDLFYQVFDKGTMKDGEGRDIDFRNTVVLMTTNAGTDVIKSLCADPETTPDPDAFARAIFPVLLQSFKPAFLGRLAVVPYYPLSDDVMRSIVRLKLGRIGRRIAETYKAAFEYAPELVDRIVARCTEVDTGARNIDHILNGTMLPELSGEILGRLARGEPIARVDVGLGADGGFSYAVG